MLKEFYEIGSDLIPEEDNTKFTLEEQADYGTDEDDFDFDDMSHANEWGPDDKEEYIRDEAELNCQRGTVLGPDDFEKFKSIGKEVNYDFTEEDFDYYFNCVKNFKDNIQFYDSIEDAVNGPLSKEELLKSLTNSFANLNEIIVRGVNESPSGFMNEWNCIKGEKLMDNSAAILQ